MSIEVGGVNVVVLDMDVAPEGAARALGVQPLTALWFPRLLGMLPLITRQAAAAAAAAAARLGNPMRCSDMIQCNLMSSGRSPPDELDVNEVKGVNHKSFGNS